METIRPVNHTSSYKIVTGDINVYINNINLIIYVPRQILLTFSGRIHLVNPSLAAINVDRDSCVEDHISNKMWLSTSHDMMKL